MRAGAQFRPAVGSADTRAGVHEALLAGEGGTGRAALPARQLRRSSGGVLAGGGERKEEGEEAEVAVARGVQWLSL